MGGMCRRCIDKQKLQCSGLQKNMWHVYMWKYDFFPLVYQDELSNIRKQLLQGFSPDDAYPSGPPLFMETPGPFSPLAQIEFPDFDEVKFSEIASPFSGS